MDAMEGMRPNVDVLALDETLNRLAEPHARQAQVVQMRCFGGLTVSAPSPAPGLPPKHEPSRPHRRVP